MLSQREIDILSYLSQRRNEFVKSSEVATILQPQIERFENISKPLNQKLKKMVQL